MRSCAFSASKMIKFGGRTKDYLGSLANAYAANFRLKFRHDSAHFLDRLDF